MKIKKWYEKNFMRFRFEKKLIYFFTIQKNGLVYGWDNCKKIESKKTNLQELVFFI